MQHLQAALQRLRALQTQAGQGLAGQVLHLHGTGVDVATAGVKAVVGSDASQD